MRRDEDEAMRYTRLTATEPHSSFPQSTGLSPCHGSGRSVVRRGRVNDLRNLGDFGHGDTAELRMRADGSFAIC